jgi:aminopeptidase
VNDPRLKDYARLLVERCVDVQPRETVFVQGTHLSRPLFEEVCRAVARRGAWVASRVSFGAGNLAWATEAPEELLAEPSAAAAWEYENIKVLIQIEAPENTREISDLDPARVQLVSKSITRILDRLVTGDIRWVGCQYPTPALAQEAGMSLGAFSEFLLGACLLDWDEEGRKMNRIKERLDSADEIRIVGDGTDVTLSIAGREGEVDDGHKNMPGGEVFYCPLEDSAEGVVTFSEFPAVYVGRELRGIRLRFEGGRVVDASAASGEDFLHEVLATDDGARRLGELGIGCNPGITRHMKNTLFDEKIDGTVHMALGRSIEEIGGVNESTVHWDIVKDLRSGGKLYADGELVQEAGAWRL